MPVRAGRSHACGSVGHAAQPSLLRACSLASLADSETSHVRAHVYWTRAPKTGRAFGLLQGVALMFFDRGLQLTPSKLQASKLSML